MWRYVLRAFLTGVAAAASSLLTAMPGLDLDDLIMAGLLGLLGGLSYAGIGAASTNVEPHIGRGGDV
jgi:hypothetical protein